jgi:hypothetical protein
MLSGTARLLARRALSTAPARASPELLRTPPPPLAPIVSPARVLTDGHGRHHSYLRLSLTERCSLRCGYCMPADGVKLTAAERLLKPAELLVLAEAFVRAGVTKIRLTGGEPTVRADLEEVVSGLSALRPLGLEHIALTSNGVTLRRRLPALKAAGLDSINISLDTLDRRRFECARSVRRVASRGSRASSRARARLWRCDRASPPDPDFRAHTLAPLACLRPPLHRPGPIALSGRSAGATRCPKSSRRSRRASRTGATARSS